MDTKRPKKIRRKHFHISGGEREYLTTNLALLLKAALPIGQALDSVAEAARSRQLRGAIAQIQQDIDSGLSLGDALANTGVFPSQTIALVKIGEQSGNLIENLQIAVTQEGKQRALRSKIQAAMVYPVFVLGLTLIIGLAVAWFLLPRLSETFDQLGVELPAITSYLLSAGTFLKIHGWWFVPVFIGGLIGTGVVLFGLPLTKSWGQRLLLHIPGISRLAKQVELARFGYLMGSLLRSGMSVVQSLELIEQGTSSPAYKKLYRHLREGFDQGYGFQKSFRSHKRAEKLVPLPVQQIISAGERSGSLSSSLENIGETYEEKADITTRNLEAILEPILLLIVAGGVMLVAVAVIMPIYSLTSSLGGQ